MEFAFIDESGDSKFKDYFGFCMAVVNSSNYKTVKSGFHSVLRKYGWAEDIEFKGAYLFSAKKGDKNVDINQRIDMASEILDLTSAEKNSRVKFYYYSQEESENHRTTYLEVLPKALKRGLTKPKGRGKGDKPLVLLSCDNRDDISTSEIRDVVLPALHDRGLSLCEEVIQAKSNFHTVGILLADIVAYLAARVDTISNDVELFESLSEEDLQNNGKVRKLNTSTELIDKVKKIQWVKIMPET